MKPVNFRSRAVLMLVITATLWSTSGLWIKVISWSPLSILSARSLVAMCVLWAYLRKPRFRPTWLELLGSVCYVLTQLTFVWATKLTTAANAIFLQYASPIYVVVLGYLFLKEKPHKADWIAMGMIFTGLFLFFGDRLSTDGMAGNILAISSGMVFAVVMLVMRSHRDENPANIIFIGNIIGFLVGMPFIFKETINLPNIGIILYLGIFQMGLSFVLYSISIQHVRTLESNLILTLEPILNPVWVFLVLGEKPGAMALIGSLLVVAAVTYRAVVSARTPEFEPVRA
ncbi:MAG TPA: DMT family transporter [Anaerolineales bacterium]|jgi:drug/metabolite transporter (DMT)-like permease